MRKDNEKYIAVPDYQFAIKYIIYRRFQLNFLFRGKKNWLNL